MTKQRFYQILAAKSGVDHKQVDAVMTALADLVRDTIAAGNDIRIPGIGKIFPALRTARRLTNPLTKEPMDVPASYHVRFRATESLKAASNR